MRPCRAYKQGTRKIKEFSWSFLHHMMLLLTTDRSKLDQRIPLTTYCSACASHLWDKTFGARSRKRMASSFLGLEGAVKDCHWLEPSNGKRPYVPQHVGTDDGKVPQFRLSRTPAVHRTGSTDPPGSLGSEADKEHIGSLFGKNRGNLSMFMISKGHDLCPIMKTSKDSTDGPHIPLTNSTESGGCNWPSAVKV